MRRVAFEVVLRACLFGSLAIFCVMVGMSFDPRIAFQTGGFLTTAMACVLVVKAYAAPSRDHRRTELWLNLDTAKRPPAAYAQWAAGVVLRETYLTFALWTAGIAIAMWALALLMVVLGIEPTLRL